MVVKIINVKVILIQIVIILLKANVKAKVLKDINVSPKTIKIV